MSRGRSAFLLASVFLSGAAVMVVEMTTVRVLQPYFGSTNYVWTNVIAVVLAALSIGYAVGGRVADKRPSAALLHGALAAGGLLVAVVAPVARPFCERLVPVSVSYENLSSFMTKGSLVATLVLFAPPVLLLALVGPMAIRLLSDGGVGRAAGRVFAVSTVGSILGTYLPTLWLIPALGSRGTLYVAAAMLLLPGVVGLLLFGGRGGGGVAAVAVLGASIAGAAAPSTGLRSPPVLEGGKARVLAERESPYQYLTVQELTGPDQTLRQLTINEGVYTYHSVEIEGSVLTGWRYYDDYALLPLLLDLAPGAELRVGVVGLACGVTARQYRHFWEGPYRVHVDGAEIDPVVLDLGREYFHLPPADAPWIRTFAMDGRQMLAAAPEGTACDVIVVDAFSQELYIPFHLGTLEFFELCRRRLAPGGVFALNVYAYDPRSPNLVALQNTLAKAFGGCARVQQHWGGNYVLVARNGARADFVRLLPSHAKKRFGARGDVAEWDKLLEQAAWIPEHVTAVAFDERGVVLTDDHCPLEAMTDSTFDRLEKEALGQ